MGLFDRKELSRGLCQVASGMVRYDMRQPQLFTSRRFFALALLFEGGLGALAVAIGYFMTPPIWERIGWRPADFGVGMLAAIPLGLGLLIIRRVRSGPLRRLNATVDHLIVPLFLRCSMAELALISAVAGVGEELLFRGVIQPAAIGWTNSWIGLTIASIAFGLVHAVTPSYALLAALAGAYFGYLAKATSNLLVPMTAHGLYDFAALIYLTRRNRSASTSLSSAQ